jgi:uncharacterized membrane protein
MTLLLLLVCGLVTLIICLFIEKRQIKIDYFQKGYWQGVVETYESRFLYNSMKEEQDETDTDIK